MCEIFFRHQGDVKCVKYSSGTTEDVKETKSATMNIFRFFLFSF